MNYPELIRARYSVRSYRETPIEPEKLEKVLEAGRLAPTAANFQPIRIYVLQSAEALEKIRSLTRCAFNAPTVLLIAYDADAQWSSPLEAGIASGQQDASIVATHMMLMARELGLGSCWVNFFPNTETAHAFGLPENEKPVLLMPMGYPAADAAPAPRHFESKPLAELVRYL